MNKSIKIVEVIIKLNKVSKIYTNTDNIDLVRINGSNLIDYTNSDEKLEEIINIQYKLIRSIENATKNIFDKLKKNGCIKIIEHNFLNTIDIISRNTWDSLNAISSRYYNDKINSIKVDIGKYIESIVLTNKCITDNCTSIMIKDIEKNIGDNEVYKILENNTENLLSFINKCNNNNNLGATSLIVSNNEILDNDTIEDIYSVLKEYINLLEKTTFLCNCDSSCEIYSILNKCINSLNAYIEKLSIDILVSLGLNI